MRNIAIIDAGPFVALFDKDDKYHHQTKERIISFRKKFGRLVTTWPMVGEAAYLLRTRVSLKAEVLFLEWMSLDNVEIFLLELIHLEKVITLQKKYGDCPMDFADATVLVAAESLRTEQVFSVDFKNFAVYRTSHKKPFQNFLESQ